MTERGNNGEMEGGRAEIGAAFFWYFYARKFSVASFKIIHCQHC